MAFFPHIIVVYLKMGLGINANTVRQANLKRLVKS